MLRNFNLITTCSTLKTQHGSNIYDNNNDDMIDGSTGETNSTAEPLNCTAQFYYDVTAHTCRPSCDWKMNNVGTIVSPVAIATSIPFAIINIIIGFTLQRDSM